MPGTLTEPPTIEREFHERSGLRVTQRVYRGFCTHNDRIPAAISIFNDMRPELERLFKNDELPDPKARQRALKYIASFYDTINNPRRMKSRILKDCR